MEAREKNDIYEVYRHYLGRHLTDSDMEGSMASSFGSPFEAVYTLFRRPQSDLHTHTHILGVSCHLPWVSR